MTLDRTKEIRMKQHSPARKAAVRGSRILPPALAALPAAAGYAPVAFAADAEGGSLSPIEQAKGSACRIALPPLRQDVDIGAVAGLGGMEAGTLRGTDMGADGKGPLAVPKLDDRMAGPVAVPGAGRHPAHVPPDTAYGRVFVTDCQADPVSVVDRASRRVVATFTVGRSPIQLLATTDGKFVYAADQGNEGKPDNRVSGIGAAGRTEVKTLPLGQAPNGIAIVVGT